MKPTSLIPIKETIVKFFKQSILKIRTLPKKYLIGGIGVIIILILVLSGGSNDAPYDIDEQITVERGTIAQTLVLSGKVESENYADLAFNSSGRIASLRVSAGDRVKKGQELARLEMGNLSAQAADAKAALTLAQLDANVIVGDIDSSQKSLDALQKEQDTLVERAYQEYLSNDLQAYSLSANEDAPAPVVTGSYIGSREGTYTLALYKSAANSGYSYNYTGIESGTGTVTTETASALGSLGLYLQFEPDVTYGTSKWVIPVPNTRSATYTQARSGYETARATRERVITDAKNALSRLETQQKSNGTSTRSVATIRQAQARLSQIYALMNEGVIRAPFDGTVGAVDFRVGENAIGGTSGITIVGGGDYNIILQVPEIDIHNIVDVSSDAAKNDALAVAVSLDAYPDMTWQGIVTHVSPVETYVDGVPVYEVTVKITNPDEKILSGMNASATIETSSIPNVLRIPLRFIDTREDGAYVYRWSDDGVEEIKVTLGSKSSDSWVVVQSGLSEGDILALPTGKEVATK